MSNEFITVEFYKNSDSSREEVKKALESCGWKFLHEYGVGTEILTFLGNEFFNINDIVNVQFVREVTITEEL